jgi:hypothetical protein
MTYLPWSMSASLTAPNERAYAQFVCHACCAKVRLHACDNGCCIITECPDHPHIMIRDGKVVGTSA